MNAACPRGESAFFAELELLLVGELPADSASALHLHLPVCEACSGELAWLRAEARLLAIRRQETPRVSPRLWAGVQERISARTQPVARWFTSRTRWLELGATFAVLVLVVVPLFSGPRGALRGSESTDPALAGMCLLSDRTLDSDASGAADEGPACVLPRNTEVSWATSMARHFSAP